MFVNSCSVLCGKRRGRLCFFREALTKPEEELLYHEYESAHLGDVRWITEIPIYLKITLESEDVPEIQVETGGLVAESCIQADDERVEIEPEACHRV
jgi:hypothetical protein